MHENIEGSEYTGRISNIKYERFGFDKAVSFLNSCKPVQVAYSRLSTTPEGRNGDLDLFILQSDGSKLRDPHNQKALLARLDLDLCDPIRLMVVDRGPDTELLAATPLEKDGRDRPRVIYDITLVLKTMGIRIFKVTRLQYGRM